MGNKEIKLLWVVWLETSKFLFFGTEKEVDKAYGKHPEVMAIWPAREEDVELKEEF